MEYQNGQLIVFLRAEGGNMWWCDIYLIGEFVVVNTMEKYRAQIIDMRVNGDDLDYTVKYFDFEGTKTL